MDVELDRNGLVDPLEDPNSSAWRHLVRRDIKHRERGHDPMSHLVVRVAFHLAGAHRQDRLGPIGRLYAGLRAPSR